LLHDNHLKTKVERGNRVFPQSDKSSDVIRLFENLLSALNVEVQLNTRVKQLICQNGKVQGVVTNKGPLYADAVIMSTGGKSYPTTGADGSGYTLAAQCGHTIVKPVPALVPLISDDCFIKELTGLSLLNVNVTLHQKRTKPTSQFGEMLFTHKGVSGPVILSLSNFINDYDETYITVDLKPALDENKLERRILRDFEAANNKDFKNALNHLFPRKLIPVMIQLSHIHPGKKINQVTVAERKSFVQLIKNFRINISGNCGFNEAIVTSGGVQTKEINSSTMESKIIKGLFFAGEVVDVHAQTGGFNIQIAYSTGMLAGENAIR